MTRSTDPDRVALIMRETADIEILPRFKMLAEGEVREKTGPLDLVTVADIESERRMTPILKDLLPGSVVVGEEAVANEPAVIDLLKNDEPVWVVDPVDGTRNFAQGSRKFCVMIALIHRRELCLSVILDPLERRYAVAERGGGSWMRGYDGGNERLAVLPGAPTREMRGAINFRFLPSPLKEAMRERAKLVVAEHYRYGCAGHEYLNLLTGKAHFSLYVKNMPWDHAPGCLLHREAGGYHARFDSRHYYPDELEGGLLIAPDEECWQALRQKLWP